jgi:hypothetical protein
MVWPTLRLHAALDAQPMQELGSIVRLCSSAGSLCTHSGHLPAYCSTSSRIQ